MPEPQAYIQKKYASTDIHTIATKFSNDPYNQPSDVWGGPYQVHDWLNGQSVVLVPNPYYTALPPAAGHPRLAQLRFVAIANEEAALALDLQSARVGVDEAELFQYVDLPALYGSRYHITVQPAFLVEHLELNQSGPLKDVRVRQALQDAVDQRLLVHALFPSLRHANDVLLPTVLPNISPWRDRTIALSPYNPDRARALLRLAGYADTFGGPGKHLLVRFVTTRSVLRQRTFQILSRFWASVGVHVTPSFVSADASDNAGLFSPYTLNGVLARRHFDIALFAFNETPDPQAYEGFFDPRLIPDGNHHSGGNQNYDGVTDHDQFTLLVQARHTLDMTLRHALFNRWQRLVNQRVYWMMLYARAYITADDGTIGNYTPNAVLGSYWNVYQWYRAGVSDRTVP